MVIIWRLKRLTVKLRKERGLDPIEDENDLPDPQQVADYVSVRVLPFPIRLPLTNAGIE